MLIRVITSIVAIAVLIPICYFSGTWVFPIAAAFFSVIAVFEMVRCIGAQRKLFMSAPLYLMSVAAPVTARLFAGKLSSFIVLYAVLIFVILLYLSTVAVFNRDNRMLDKVAVLYITCLYIITGFTSLVLLRDLPNGHFIYLIAFIAPWVSDSFAYLTGRLFGKHKLIPEISPKKTVEGCIGGIIFSAIAVMLYGAAIDFFFHMAPKYSTWLIAGVLIAIVSQIGDLYASLIKRRYGIKDYGNLFPGHGGVLDRFDSVIPTAPILLIVAAMPLIESMFTL